MGVLGFFNFYLSSKKKKKVQGHVCSFGSISRHNTIRLCLPMITVGTIGPEREREMFYLTTH